MSSFRPNPEDIGPDGYLKKEAVEVREQITDFNNKLKSEVVEGMENDTQTGGTSAIPMFIWYIAGAGILLYVAKKQKWI
tara:strand:- start:331 stop:567 length:237 start_codon:yes stop_codon:yes gene_type:complete